MALPAAYDELRLAAFMRVELGRVADVLGWTNVEQDGDYQEAVNDALLGYDVDDVADAVDLAKLRAWARVAVWRAAYRSVASETDILIGDQSIKASVLQAQIGRSLEQATKELLVIAPSAAVSGWSVGIGKINLGNSPYRPRSPVVAE